MGRPVLLKAPRSQRHQLSMTSPFPAHQYELIVALLKACEGEQVTDKAIISGRCDNPISPQARGRDLTPDTQSPGRAHVRSGMRADDTRKGSAQTHTSWVCEPASALYLSHTFMFSLSRLFHLFNLITHQLSLSLSLSLLHARGQSKWSGGL